MNPQRPLRLAGAVGTKAGCQPQPPSHLGKAPSCSSYGRPELNSLHGRSFHLRTWDCPHLRKKSPFQVLRVSKQTAPAGCENKVANRSAPSGVHVAAVLGHLQAGPLLTSQG